MDQRKIVSYAVKRLERVLLYFIRYVTQPNGSSISPK